MNRTVSILVLLILTFRLSAQKDSSSNEPKKITAVVVEDVKNTGSTILYCFKRPLHWKKREWIQVGLVSGVTVLSVFADESVNDFFKENKTHFLDQLASVGDFLGQPEYNLPFYITLWGSGVVFRNEWLRNTGSMVFASVAVSGIFQTIAKEATGRARPSAEEGNLSFKPFEGGVYHSFPSGHTMLAVSTAWILARQTNRLAVKIAFYSVPVVVGWSRLYDNAHWLSDVVLGSAIGIASAEAVLKFYPKIKANGGSHKNIVFMPSFNSFKLVYQF